MNLAWLALAALAPIPPSESSAAASLPANADRREQTDSIATPADDARPCESFEAAIAAPTERSGAAFAFQLLEAARCIALTECAPLLTSELNASVRDRPRLAEAAGRILRYVAEAEKALDAAEMDQTDSDRADVCIDLFRSLGELFRAIAATDGSDASKKALMDSCIGLALYMDDPRGGVVEAARLWQGVGYRRAGRPDRALQVLRPAITPPTSRVVGLYARLERCRALADKGRFAAAIALALRLSGRVDAWFEQQDAQTRKAAADTVRRMRAQLLQDWATDLRKAGERDRAAEAEEEAHLLMGTDVNPSGAEDWLLLPTTMDEAPLCAPPSAKPEVADSQPSD